MTNVEKLGDERLGAVFNALSHPRRVRIYRLLSQQPELARSLDALQQATGYKETPLLHHLQVMERAGIIRRQRKGNNVARTLTPGPLTAAMAQVAGFPSPGGRSHAR